MGKTRERAWRSTDNTPFRRIQTLPKKLKPKTSRTGIRDVDFFFDWGGYNKGKTMGKTTERAWRNTDTQKKKLTHTQKLFYDDDDDNGGDDDDDDNDNDDNDDDHDDNGGDDDDDDNDDNDDDDVELLDTKQEQSELVKNASPMSDSLRGDDGDVELVVPKQEECELVENVSPMSDSIGYNIIKTRERAWRNTATQKKKLKQTQKLLDDDGDVELLVPKQEQRELVENKSPKSDSLEKFSSLESGIICVQGYNVKQSNATILEAIFKKHGDIAAKCVFKTDSVRSSFLEVVCEVVRRIQTNDVIEKMEEIDCRVSDAEAANIDVTWLRAHLEAINKRKETSKKYTLLMEMKENMILVKKAAQIDLRERYAELVAAQQRFKTAERCVRVLHLVEKNLSDHIMESKAKLDSWVNHPVV